MRLRDDDGQAIIMVALAMSIFLLGAVGLAVDGAHLYAQRQMAQSAADAAAQAGIMSIFDGTESASTLPCSASDTRTACSYARKNGFGAASTDTVTPEYFGGNAAAGAAPGVTLSADSTNVLRVTVARQVPTTLMRLLGPTVTTISASATAAIVSVQSPTPILITDPSNPTTFYMNGTTSITICGGPTRSIQVNSSNAAAFSTGGTIDLQHAGPADPGTCSTGTGADFGIFGGPSSSSTVLLGSTGHYVAPASPIQDPFANVPAPAVPGTAGGTKSVNNGTDGCTSATCIEYSPGVYPQLKPGKTTVLFRPGLYYVQGGGVDFKQTIGGGANYSAMCVGCPSDPNTGNGMVIYDTVAAGVGAYPANTNRPTGGFNIGTQAFLTLQGAANTSLNAKGQTVPGPPYYGLLFWEDRTANANSHILGQGNGCFTLIGTIYITNTYAIMNADSNHHQYVEYHGTPCSTTVQQGDIIVSQLALKGTTSLKMNLLPYGFLNIRQVALVN